MLLEVISLGDWAMLRSVGEEIVLREVGGRALRGVGGRAFRGVGGRVRSRELAGHRV